MFDSPVVLTRDSHDTVLITFPDAVQRLQTV